MASKTKSEKNIDIATLLQKRTNGSLPTTIYMTITPDMAKQFLSAMASNNRKTSRHVVLNYASQMKQGLWKVTPEGICIDKNGVVINAKHRLQAIIESQTAIVMSVTYGLTPDAIYGIDLHKKRTAGDILTLDGCFIANEAKELTETITAAIVLSPSERWGYTSRKVNANEIEEFYYKYHDGCRFSLESSHYVNRRKPLGCVRAAILRAFYHVDLPTLNRFVETLQTGVVEGEDESAVIRLRDVLVSAKTTLGGLSRIPIYKKAENAILLFSKHTPTKRLAGINKELFPLEGEEDLMVFKRYEEINKIENRVRKG